MPAKPALVQVSHLSLVTYYLLLCLTVSLVLQANIRDKSPKASRRAKTIPAVIYGHGVKSKSIAVDTAEFKKVYREAGSTSLVSLHVDGGTEHPVLIREIQHHPVKDEIIHADFYQVRMDEEIRAQVPLTFTGEAPAIKDMGGTLIRSLDEIDLSALPANLPHTIEVDISGLDNFEKVIHVSDLKLPDGVELHHEPGDVIALVQAPKTQDQIDAELTAEVSEDVASVEGVADKPEEGTEEAAEGEAPAAKGEEKKAE